MMANIYVSKNNFNLDDHIIEKIILKLYLFIDNKPIFRSEVEHATKQIVPTNLQNT